MTLSSLILCIKNTQAVRNSLQFLPNVSVLFHLGVIFSLRMEVYPGFTTAIKPVGEGQVMLQIDVSHRILRKDTAYEVMYTLYNNARSDQEYQRQAMRAILGQTVMTMYDISLHIYIYYLGIRRYRGGLGITFLRFSGIHNWNFVDSIVSHSWHIWQEIMVLLITCIQLLPQNGPNLYQFW